MVLDLAVIWLFVLSRLCVVIAPAKASVNSLPHSFICHLSIRKCQFINELHAYSQVKKLAQGHPWITFAMVREPAERFLSGYLSIYKPGICKEGRLKKLRAVLLQTLKLSQRFASGTWADNNLLWHLGPQNWHLELRNNFDAFKLIQYSSKNRGKVTADLRDVLTEGGVDFSQIELIISQVSNGTTRHATYYYEETAEYEKLMQDAEIQELLTKIFFWDYVLFNFPLPQLRNDTFEESS
ncbi:unnamed protein product [Cylicocyclus nassatus]|uniref:Sulfotransferase n=1 Tax=Cylicocyclus nassatus TaxID=53992 RepID=A0AA36H4D1_CYLNA|nr:unnamed protein product [Cylicocyclus nassatus]